MVLIYFAITKIGTSTLLNFIKCNYLINYFSEGMSKTVFDKNMEPLETPVWRLVGPEFETWEARGEITATR